MSSTSQMSSNTFHMDMPSHQNVEMEHGNNSGYQPKRTLTQILCSVINQEEGSMVTNLCDHWRAFIGEFIGTMFLLFVTVCAALIPGLPGLTENAASNVVLQALAAFFCLTTLVFTLGGVSGAHMNPAITLSLMTVKAIHVKVGLVYWAFQFAGALVGAAFALVCLGSQNAGSLAVNSYNPSIVSSGQAFFVEVILSTFFYWVVLATAVDTRVPLGKLGLAALPVGLVFGTCVLIGGALSGAALNPARAFASAALANQWTSLWIYMIGPFVAAFITGILYKLVFMTKSKPSL